jgi:hypothetical protein
MSKNTGTLVGAAIRPIDSNDLISTAYENEIRGGHHGYETLSERNSIIIQRRSWGMLCTVYNDGSNNGTYQLKYGYSSTTITDNSNWILFSGGSGAAGSEYWLDPVISVSTSEPGSPSNGDRYIAGLDNTATLSGSNWSSYTGGYIVTWNNTLSDWDKTSPKNGYTLRVQNEDDSLYRYEGTYSSGKWVKEYVNQVMSLTASTSNGYTYTSTSLPNLFSYNTNQVYLTRFSATNSGTSSVTLNINSLGAKSIKKQTSNGLDDLLVSELNPNITYTLMYDGTYFRLNKPFSNAPFDIKWRIRSNEIVQVPDYNEYLIYGDLTVEGRLDIDTYGKVVILDGGLILNGGTVSNSGNVQLVDLALGPNSGGGTSSITKFTTLQSMSAGVTYSITHGLSTPAIIVNTWDETTGEQLNLSVAKTSNDAIDINSVNTISSVRIVVMG